MDKPTIDEMINKLAQAQSALYAIVDTLPKAEDRISIMEIHSNIGEVLYDLNQMSEVPS